jgi:hypothetical protein
MNVGCNCRRNLSVSESKSIQVRMKIVENHYANIQYLTRHWGRPPAGPR